MGCRCGRSIATKHFQGHEAFHARYMLGKKLGAGSFGQVRAASLRPLENESTAAGSREPAAAAVPQFAVKILDLNAVHNKDGPTNAELLEDAVMEHKAWQLVCASGHPNVLQLIDTFVEASKKRKIAYYVMELCRGSLLDRCNISAFGNEDSFSKLANGMVSALVHMHACNVVHRDLKPDNFLLSEAGEIKVADFGLAALVPKSGYLYLRAGTAPYMAPEVVAEEAYSFEIDTWSLGVTCYVMLLGDFPYKPTKSEGKTSQGYRQAVLKGLSPSFRPADPSWPLLSGSATAFVSSCLTRKRNFRPSAETLSQYEFVHQRTQTNMLKPNENALALSHVVNRARKLAKNVPKTVKIDPTVQRDIDALLMELQTTYGGRVGLRRTFSTDIGKSRTSEASFLEFRDSAKTGKSKLARSSTHTGMGLSMDDKNDDDNDSPCTSGQRSQTSTLDSLPPMNSSGQMTFDSLPLIVTPLTATIEDPRETPSNSASLSQASTQAASATMEQAQNGTTNSKELGVEAAGDYCGERPKNPFEEGPSPELRQIAIDLEDLPEVPVPMIPTRNTNHRQQGLMDPTEAQIAH